MREYQNNEHCSTRCDTVRELAGTLEQLQQRTVALEQQASHDDLTASLRRNHFFMLSERQFSLARRHQRPLSVLLLDADHFKAINDNFGHAVGDEVLRSIATICHNSLRTTDIFGRYGGEEFAITLPETALADAAIVAERIRGNVASSTISCKGYDPISCTISVGMASHHHAHSGFAELLNAADEALLEAKRLGRNCVAASSTGE